MKWKRSVGPWRRTTSTACLATKQDLADSLLTMGFSCVKIDWGPKLDRNRQWCMKWSTCMIITNSRWIGPTCGIMLAVKYVWINLRGLGEIWPFFFFSWMLRSERPVSVEIAIGQVKYVVDSIPLPNNIKPVSNEGLSCRSLKTHTAKIRWRRNGPWLVSTKAALRTLGLLMKSIRS
jgi:hypothetical protein